MKNIVLLTGSPRKNGNSAMLADAFAKGAEKAGHVVKRFDTAMRKVAPCMACGQCWTSGEPCVIEDDFISTLYPMLRNADAIVFCFPLYFCSYPAQLKACIDRFHSCAPYAQHPLPMKESALLACAANADASMFDGLIHNYKATAAFEKWEDKGIVIVPGVYAPGDVAKTDSLAQAENLGRNF